MINKIASFLVLLLFSVLVAESGYAGVVVWAGSTGLFPNEIAPPYSVVDTSINDPTLIGGVLTLDTDSDGELMLYSMTGTSIAMPASPAIDFNMRVISQSTSFPSLRTGAAVSITTKKGVGNVVYFGIDEVFFLTTGGLRGPEAIIDTDSDFHDYRIEVGGLNSGSTISLFQDGSLVLTHVLVNDPPNYGNEPRIFFGNNTALAHGTSEWISFEHNAGILLADVNLDGVVNLLDVDAFIELLSTGTFQAEADCNQDGEVNLLDVDFFIAILAGG